MREFYQYAERDLPGKSMWLPGFSWPQDSTASWREGPKSSKKFLFAELLNAAFSQVSLGNAETLERTSPLSNIFIIPLELEQSPAIMQPVSVAYMSIIVLERTSICGILSQTWQKGPDLCKNLRR